MAKQTIFALSFIFIFSYGLAQAPDAAVIVHQSTLNGFLTAIGPLEGSDQFNVLGTKGTYTWTLKNAHIELKHDQAVFTADAGVKVGPFSTGSVATGDVEVKYHPETNRISVKVLKAMFEVYTKIFGKKIHITDVDASKFYRPEFEFAGPTPIQPSVDIALPGGGKKTIYIKPKAQNLKIEQDQIIVSSNLVFADHPIQ